MGKNWAITIGINEYRYLQKLSFARQDADVMRDFSWMKSTSIGSTTSLTNLQKQIEIP